MWVSHLHTNIIHIAMFKQEIEFKHKIGLYYESSETRKKFMIFNHTYVAS